MRDLFNKLLGVRGAKREQILSQCANRFYFFLKNNGYTRFNKMLLKANLPDEMTTRTQQRTIKAILEQLLSEGKISVNSFNKVGNVFYRLKPLFCCDSGSYGVMMAKNGYKVGYYNYVKKPSQAPLRVKIGELHINETPLFNFDVAVKQSNKPRDKQKVLTSSALSIAKCRNNYKVKIFNVL